MPKKITLEKLAQMTQNGFNEMKEKIDKRFEGVDKKFEGVDKRFEVVDKKFEEVNKKIDALPDKEFVENLVTKNIGLLRKDLVIVIRKEDKKVELLIDILKNEASPAASCGVSGRLWI